MVDQILGDKSAGSVIHRLHSSLRSDSIRGLGVEMGFIHVAMVARVCGAICPGRGDPGDFGGDSVAPEPGKIPGWGRNARD